MTHCLHIITIWPPVPSKKQRTAPVQSLEYSKQITTVQSGFLHKCRHPGGTTKAMWTIVVIVIVQGIDSTA